VDVLVAAFDLPGAARIAAMRSPVQMSRSRSRVMLPSRWCALLQHATTSPFVWKYIDTNGA
jgi:hypothetical protein